MSGLNVQQNSHFDAIYTLLPADLKAGIDDLLARATRESAVKHTLDQLVRFSLGRDSTDEDLDSREEWDIQKRKAEKALSGLQLEGGQKGQKRTRDEGDSGPVELPTNSKRPKIDIDVNQNIDEDPLFTLHSVSVSSPVRKKVNVTVYRKGTLRFMHTTSGVQEASLSLSTLTRAFLIPTPGKTKPHWTIIMLSESNQTQVIFGLDAIPPSLTVTAHPESQQIYPKGTESKSILTQFISHLPPHIKFQEPSTKQFRSPAGDPYLDAYLRAKDGHLFFFEDGLLFGEKKPCIWIGVDQIENVRSLSATGRTFSFFVTRVADAAQEEPGEGEETEFSLIDGKNQDAVALWVKTNRPRFGSQNDPNTSIRSATNEQDELGEGEDKPDGQKVDGDSEDDSDFQSDSDSDGGSATSQSSSDDNNDQAQPEEDARSSDDGEGEDEGEGEGEDEDEDEGELSPLRHPLLRPGAMPKMSKAAINAVIGMVEEDMMDTVRGKVEAGDDEDEHDELED